MRIIKHLWGEDGKPLWNRQTFWVGSWEGGEESRLNNQSKIKRSVRKASRKTEGAIRGSERESLRVRGLENFICERSTHLAGSQGSLRSCKSNTGAESQIHRGKNRSFVGRVCNCQPFPYSLPASYPWRLLFCSSESQQNWISVLKPRRAGSDKYRSIILPLWKTYFLCENIIYHVYRWNQEKVTIYKSVYYLDFVIT